MSCNRLLKICIKALQDKNLVIEEYQDRFKREFKEITKKDECDYFLELHAKVSRQRKQGKNITLPNEHNLLIPYLLGICEDFDIKKPEARTPLELPDIDVDFLAPIRDYLKQEWAPKEFGEDCVSNIGTYTTYDIKNSLIDMARVFNLNHQEVLSVTTQLGTKDDDGDKLTWDKALEIYPAFKTYAEKYPEVADAAKRLCHRNRGMGTHAGGLIISNKPLSDFAPIIMGKEQKLQTAWTEGLHAQDLQPVGLIKFDLLVITNLLQIAICCKLIKERHGIDKICALPGRGNWSDTSYLNDPKALKMADRGDLICVFQFDSPGIRQLVRDGGVTSFDDLVAYTSLYRPGALSSKMHTSYCKRKKGEEKYDIHKKLKPILDETYGVLIYQESVMQILNVVGEIPLEDCETVRKAISKKKIEQFSKYKEMFVRNGQKNLKWSEEKINKLWDNIEAFSAYGFNKSHAVAYTYISSRLLYLKAHYPEEFYAAILSCVAGNDKYEKLREYKKEAEKHGVKVERLNLNKSKENFTLADDNKIYYGFSTIKGIGEEVALRIVEGQPYKNFEDFLSRFGTDAKALQALIALRIFKDSNPIKLYKFYEFYKDQQKKRSDRQKRYEKSMERYANQLKELNIKKEDLEQNCQELQKKNMMEDFEKAHAKLLETEKEISTVEKRRERSINSFTEKEKMADKYPLSLEDFNPAEYDIDAETEELLLDQEKSEATFYGFIWTHPLEKSPDYSGLTFDNAKMEEAKGNNVVPVELMIQDIKEKTSKKRKDFKFYSLRVQDCDYVERWVTVWEEDFKRFKNHFEVGNLVRMKLKSPSGGFNSYTLYAPPRYKRSKLPPKEQDYRVVELRIFDSEKDKEPEKDICDVILELGMILE